MAQDLAEDEGFSGPLNTDFQDAETQEIMQTFKLFDTSGDDEIDDEELHAVFTRFGFQMDLQTAQEMLQLIDANGDGKIQLNEFIPLVRQHKDKQMEMSYEKQLREAFNIFDLDGDGVLTATELAEVFRALGENVTEDDITFLQNSIDKNGDGEIDFNEFLELMSSNPYEMP